MGDERRLKRYLEALLFVSDKPLTLASLKEVTGGDTREIEASLRDIRGDCDTNERGFRLRELAGGYQFTTDPSLSEDMKRFFQVRERRKLSQPSLETLSIIAYRQPVTRGEIEYIRGVNVDAALRTLLEKGMIRITGRKEVPGRPLLYATTPDFLDHFGLSTIKALPKLVEFSEKDIELPETLKKRGEVPSLRDLSGSARPEA